MPARPQNALANSNEHDQVPLTQGAYSPLAATFYRGSRILSAGDQERRL